MILEFVYENLKNNSKLTEFTCKTKGKIANKEKIDSLMKENWLF